MMLVLMMKIQPTNCLYVQVSNFPGALDQRWSESQIPAGGAAMMARGTPCFFGWQLTINKLISEPEKWEGGD